MSRTMPRFGLAVGSVTFAQAFFAGLDPWIPLFGALIAFVHGAWRLAALNACLCLCFAMTESPLVDAFPCLFAEPVMLAPSVMLSGLGVWLAFDYRRFKASTEVRRLPAWLCMLRDRAGVAVGWNSVVVAFGAVMYVPLLPILGPGWWWDPYARSIDALFPVAILGTLTAFACGAWRTATLGAYVLVQARLMVDATIFLIVGVMLAACLVWSYRRSASREVGPA